MLKKMLNRLNWPSHFRQAAPSLAPPHPPSASSPENTWQLAEGAIRVGWVSVAGLSRTAARQHVRQALAGHTAGLAGRGDWHETPQGPVAAAAEVSLSLSYAGEVAVWAVGRGCKLGVDLVQCLPLADWRAVSQLYLGEAVTAQLAACTEAARPAAFAEAWAQLEARSKCLGLPLTEWHAASTKPTLSPATRHAALARCQTATLTDLAGYVLVVAWQEESPLVAASPAISPSGGGG